MKSIFLLCLFSLAFCSNIALADQRFKQYNIHDIGVYLLVDHKTGCEYFYSPKGGVEFIHGSCDKTEDKSNNNASGEKQ